jgi:hypothetical protein
MAAYNFALDVPRTLVTPYVVRLHPVWGGNINGYTTRMQKPRALVVHTPEEEADQTEQTPLYFARWGVYRSTHYYGDNDGDLYQMVSDLDAAWGQGTDDRNRVWKGRKGGYPPWNTGGISNNLITLGYETEGFAATLGSTMTRAQFTTLARWIAYKCWQYDIPCDRTHVVGHYELASDKTDPGTLPLDEVVLAAKMLMQGGSVDDVLFNIASRPAPEVVTSSFNLADLLQLAWQRGYTSGQNETRDFVLNLFDESETTLIDMRTPQANHDIWPQIEDLMP